MSLDLKQIDSYHPHQTDPYQMPPQGFDSRDIEPFQQPSMDLDVRQDPYLQPPKEFDTRHIEPFQQPSMDLDMRQIN